MWVNRRALEKLGQNVEAMVADFQVVANAQQHINESTRDHANVVTQEITKLDLRVTKLEVQLEAYLKLIADVLDKPKEK